MLDTRKIAERGPDQLWDLPLVGWESLACVLHLPNYVAPFRGLQATHRDTSRRWFESLLLELRGHYSNFRNDFGPLITDRGLDLSVPVGIVAKHERRRP